VCLSADLYVTRTLNLIFNESILFPRLCIDDSKRDYVIPRYGGLAFWSELESITRRSGLANDICSYCVVVNACAAKVLALYYDTITLCKIYYTILTTPFVTDEHKTERFAIQACPFGLREPWNTHTGTGPVTFQLPSLPT
jgi:hypothetical protein